MIRDFGLKIFKTLRDNWILLFILILGAFLRLYKIGDYMTFLGDEGRDVIIVRNLLTKADFFLIGPGTSVGNMYLGPLYYYLIALPLLLFNFSPVGPAVFVALLGVFTIYFVYVVGRDWFSKKAGLIASLLFAVSPTVITFSHSSWNPNIMPFFALLSIYSTWKFWKKGEYSWLIFLGIAFAFVLQSHYLGLLLAPTLFIFWIWRVLSFKLVGNWTKEVSDFVRMSIFGLTSFLLLMSPLLLFDIRHGWINTNSLVTFISNREVSVTENIFDNLLKLPKVAESVTTSLLAAGDKNIGKLLLVVVSIPSLFFILNRKKLHKNEASGFLFLSIWLFFGFFGFAIYKYAIYDHYFGFLFPALFLFFAGFVDGVSDNLNKFGTVLLYTLVAVLVVWNLWQTPILSQPNRQMQRAQSVSNKVLEIADGKPFNLAVLAERNYEDGYRYFMDVAGAIVLDADSRDPRTISDTLIVICEMPKEKCDPTHSAKAEVANFGWSKIDSDFEVDGVIIYKLIHNN